MALALASAAPAAAARKNRNTSPCRSDGFTQVGNRFLREHSRHLHPRAAMLYMMLRSHADYHTGACFPTVRTLAEELGVSPQCVHTHLRTLEQQGYIRIDSGKHSDSPNTYYILPLGEGSNAKQDQVANPVATRSQAPLTPGVKPALHRTPTKEREPYNENHQQGGGGGEISVEETTGDAAQPDMHDDDPGAYRMPFGQYKGMPLNSLPEEYLAWASTAIARRDAREAIAVYLEARRSPPGAFPADGKRPWERKDTRFQTPEEREREEFLAAWEQQPHVELPVVESRTPCPGFTGVTALLDAAGARYRHPFNGNFPQEASGSSPASPPTPSQEAVRGRAPKEETPPLPPPAWEEPDGWELEDFRTAIQALDPYVKRYRKGPHDKEIDARLNACYARFLHLNRMPLAEVREIYREYFAIVVAAGNGTDTS
ncbi:MAG: helix-turn-helix domain-containing protein [Armatimonadota bacterium]